MQQQEAEDHNEEAGSPSAMLPSTQAALATLPDSVEDTAASLSSSHDTSMQSAHAAQLPWTQGEVTSPDLSLEDHTHHSAQPALQPALPQPVRHLQPYPNRFCARAGLPSRHPLRQLQSAQQPAARLYHSIFGTLSVTSPAAARAGQRSARNLAQPSALAGSVPHVSKKRAGLLPVMQQLIDRARRYNNAAAASASAQRSLLSADTPADRVAAFIWSIIRHIVPQALLGGAHNRSKLRQHLLTFIKLRRWEYLSVHQLLKGLRITELPLLTGCKPGVASSPSGHAAGSRRLARWLQWLFTYLVIPLLRAHFYVTDSMIFRQQIFYYRKPVWRQLRSVAVAELRRGVYAPLTRGDVRVALTRNRVLGWGKLRLVPKHDSMRPIVSMSSHSRYSRRGRRLTAHSRRRSRGAIKLDFKPVNACLQDALKVLRYESSRPNHPNFPSPHSALGASVSGNDDIHPRLHAFLRQWRATCGSALHSPARPYIVCADIKGAYESVDTGVVMQLVEGLLTSPSYLLIQYGSVGLGRLGAVRPQWKQTLVQPCQPQGFAGFPALAAHLASKTASSVLYDKVVYGRVQRSSILALVREAVTHTLVRAHGTFYHQRLGISQGCCLSPLLCSLYLAHMEHACLHDLLPPCAQPPAPGQQPDASRSSTHLSSLAAAAAGSASRASGICSPPSIALHHNTARQAGAIGQLAVAPSHHQNTGTARQHGRKQPSPSLMMRLTDDFLIITPSYVAAEAVTMRLLHGLPGNLTVNPAKTRLNFDLQLPGADGPIKRSVWVDGAGRGFVRWCGLLVNECTLEVQGDYTRYAGHDLMMAMALPLHKAPGAVMTDKLCHFLRHKLHPLFLDTFINSPATVQLNLYQSARLAGAKFSCLVRALGTQQRGRHRGDARAVMHAIDAACCWLVAAVPTRCTIATRRHGIPCRCSVTPRMIRWLALKGLHDSLQRHRAAHAPVLAALQSRLRHPAFRDLPGRLSAVTDPAKSTVFDDIMF
ncbi:hypothetical protein WJX73_003177 [Symbiochloris irregularis]|uniref:Telomerase reverse transcriptase n=1 Tax=Symbiochloris irregularis TaxID=706552 RepID=A0AAW1NTT1_9CHLO